MHFLMIAAMAAAFAVQTPVVPQAGEAPYQIQVGRSGAWTVLRNDVGCAATVSYRPGADGARRTLTIAWVARRPDRRLMILMTDSRWREAFAPNRNDYRLEYVGPGPAGVPDPPPVAPARVASVPSADGAMLAILFDEAAMPTAMDSLARSIGFEIYRGRRLLATHALAGVAGALQLLRQCAATWNEGGTSPGA